MSHSLKDLKIEQLTARLKEKTALYNEMINNNKQFEEVKTLFIEIKEIVKALTQMQEPKASIFLNDITPQEKSQKVTGS
jgi:hypothetical protein